MRKLGKFARKTSPIALRSERRLPKKQQRKRLSRRNAVLLVSSHPTLITPVKSCSLHRPRLSKSCPLKVLHAQPQVEAVSMRAPLRCQNEPYP